MKRLWMLLAIGCACLWAQDHPGQPVYVKYCEQCHGVDGDGKGAAEPFVDPKPRDFTAGTFKFRGTPSGYLPTDADLQRVVRLGIPGTSMPAFAQIGEQQIVDVADYIKVFFQDRIERDKADGYWPPKTISMGAQPSVNDELIKKGRATYLSAGCGDCHGLYGRADGPSALTLENDNGEPTRPANLAMKWRFRGGPGMADIYRAFSTGISGTPMPNFGETMSEEDRWAIAAYVHGLSPARQPEAAAQVNAAQIEGDLPTTADDPAWDGTAEAYFPMSAQIIWEPVNTHPTVDGVHVRALHNGEKLALRLQWDDPSYSVASGGDEEEDAGKEDDFDDFFAEEETVTVLNDGFAIQFPSGEPKLNERPYLVMGDGQNPVNLWRWTNKAGREAVEPDGDLGDYAKYHTAYAGPVTMKNQIAKGRDQVEPLADGSPLTGEVRYDNGTYTLVVQRDLTPANASEVAMEGGAFVPILLWAWDGHNEEKGAKASLSSWYWLILGKPVENSVYVKTAGAAVLMIVLQVLAIQAALRRKRQNGGADEAEAASAVEEGSPS